jgi:hypothetical protein
MRLAHHLLRHPSGVFHFRLVVPADLRQVFGKKIVKISLRTKDPAAARAYAYSLGARYAHAIAEARGGRMGKGNDDYLSHLRKFEIVPQADGRLSVKTDGSDQDNAAALRALAMLTQQPPASAPVAPPAPSVELLAGVHQQLLAAFSTPAAPPASTAPTLSEAFELYTQVEVPNLKADTWQQRERAIRSFIGHVGGDVQVDYVTRPMASQWATELQRSGLTKRYVANMVSHAAQLFSAQVRAGHVPHGQNPVRGVVTLSTADKRLIRSSGRGWEPFDLPTLHRIYAPESLKRVAQQHTRWCALMGLYTGARVAELAQVYLRDFIAPDGIKCVHLTDENDGQSLKTEHSRRLVPLHPDLLALGLWDRVERLRAMGEERLFPEVRLDGKSGPGNAVSKGFSYLLARLDIKPRRINGTVGFHSLRKTFIQQLQGTALPSERRRALVGHEAGEDVHATDYMREWKADELAAFFPGLPWGNWLDFSGLKSLLT